MHHGIDLAEYEEPVTWSSWIYLAIPIVIVGAFGAFRFFRRNRPA
jgi:hypothetical protein